MVKKAVNGALLGLLAAIVVWLLAKIIAPDLMYSYEAKTYDWRVEQKIYKRCPFCCFSHFYFIFVHCVT